MLSYQHIYHAGNFADVQKHTALITTLELMTQHHVPLFYCDTHAGRGYYNLYLKEAKKIEEFKTGITRMRGLGSKHPIIARYLKLVGDDKYVYPGSSIMAAKLLRPKDVGYCFELHPQEFEALAAAMKLYLDQFTVQKKDGYHAIDEIDHAQFKRGLTLIDPSYETKDEYALVQQKVTEIMHNHPKTTVMIWYPILPAGLHKDFAFENALQYEFFVRSLEGERGMAGSGLWVVNPPNGLAEKLKEVAPILRTALAQDRTAHFTITN